jgi:hypothetical protein
MNELTYTAELVNFDPTNQIIRVNIFLPTTIGLQVNATHNLSKQKFLGKHINAILCHVNGGNGSIVCGNGSINLIINNVSSLPQSDELYDFGIANCLLLVLHDDAQFLDPDDVKFIFNNLKEFHDMAINGSFVIKLNDPNQILLRPRALGVSLIR